MKKVGMFPSNIDKLIRLYRVSCYNLLAPLIDAADSCNV